MFVESLDFSCEGIPVPSEVEGNGRTSAHALDFIIVQGFKSLRDRTQIEIGPLTLLAGANSSGKSSVMQPLLMLKQTLEVAYDPGPLLLSGPNVRFTSVEQLLWRGRNKTDRASGFEIAMSANGARVTFVFSARKVGVELTRVEYDLSKGIRGVLREKMRSAEVKRALGHMAFEHRLWDAMLQHFEFRVIRKRCTLSACPIERNGENEVALQELFSPTDRFEPIVSGLIHLPGLRGHPERAYPATQVSERFPGQFQPYAASIISSWKAAHDERFDQLGKAMFQLGLTWRVDTHSIDETQLELRVGRLPKLQKGGAGDMVNLADVGFGVSQVLPVVVALLVAKPGQVVYLEQPEIHLHPRAQVALAQILLEAAKRGVIVVAETHSHLLLKGVQERIASGMFEPQLVKLHWFQRDGKLGATKVASAQLDESGAFGDWPEDFAAVELDVEDRYLRAAMDGTAT